MTLEEKIDQIIEDDGSIIHDELVQKILVCVSETVEEIIPKRKYFNTWDDLFDRPGGEDLTEEEKSLFVNGYNRAIDEMSQRMTQLLKK